MPSILITILSWVSFWINYDASAARVALGEAANADTIMWSVYGQRKGITLVFVYEIAFKKGVRLWQCLWTGSDIHPSWTRLAGDLPPLWFESFSVFSPPSLLCKTRVACEICFKLLGLFVFIRSSLPSFNPAPFIHPSPPALFDKAISLIDDWAVLRDQSERQARI